MSKEETKNFYKRCPCFRGFDFAFISNGSDLNNDNISIIMVAISVEQEEKLDNGESVTVNCGTFSFLIEPYNTIGYGALELCPNGKDIKILQDAKCFARYTIRHWMPTIYDYETHTRGVYHNGIVPQYDTSNLSTYLPYIYACIGKPERTCIFKYYHKAKADEARKQKKRNYDNAYAKNNKEKRREYQARAIKKRTAKRLALLTFKIK